MLKVIILALAFGIASAYPSGIPGAISTHTYTTHHGGYGSYGLYPGAGGTVVKNTEVVSSGYPGLGGLGAFGGYGYPGLGGLGGLGGYYGGYPVAKAVTTSAHTAAVHHPGYYGYY